MENAVEVGFLDSEGSAFFVQHPSELSQVVWAILGFIFGCAWVQKSYLYCESDILIYFPELSESFEMFLEHHSDMRMFWVN